MKKSPLFLSGFCLLLSACGGGQSREVIESSLRPPAYPLVTIDPYISAWAYTDNLYDGHPKHWTDRDFPLLGVIMVDGLPYRFMGTEDIEMRPIAPTSEQGEWHAMYTTDKPAADWKDPGFNDSKWENGQGAFGTRRSEPTSKTDWRTENIWVRRTVTIDEDLQGKPVYIEYSNDDDALIYINGHQVVNTGPVVRKNVVVQLPDEIVATLKRGENLIAATCRNPRGAALIDFGLLTPKSMTSPFEKTAVQKSVDVQAMQTHYLFSCGGVDLRFSFSAPSFMDDLKLLSRPVNYMTYEMSSTDGAAHEVKLYLEASPRWALNQPYEACTSESFEDGGLLFLKSGSREQDVLGKKGDHIRIDWGYFYLAAEKQNTTTNIGPSDELRAEFMGAASQKRTKGEDSGAKMSLIRDLGSVKKSSGKVMIGYDDIYSIQYFGDNLRGYWNSDGTQTITGQFHAANKDHAKLIDKCYKFDKELMETAAAAGGQKYAELCALAYRQAVAAHKLVEAPNGDLLWLSKENDSNGSIGTVDITYPSAPLFLYYNPELAKALMNHIFYYAESGKWAKPFPSHDVGTYPIANGQTYGGDMPVEESGNMLVLAAAIAAIEGNAAYAEKHWEVLTVWADYLAEYGLDPENQLCTDDFAGHFAHNANLSVKAIMGVASYGRLADMLGKKDVAEKYTAEAKEMAREWMRMADDGDHYRLTFDKPGTWSQKYNLVWNKLLKFGVFPTQVAQKEIAYYLTKQNVYGLPLDNRMEYTKTDWVVWTATMADDKATFEKFIDPLWKFENETLDRVPMSDWIWTDKPYRRGFKARAVVGGYYIKMLEEKLDKKVK